MKRRENRSGKRHASWFRFEFGIVSLVLLLAPTRSLAGSSGERDVKGMWWTYDIDEAVCVRVVCWLSSAAGWVRRGVEAWRRSTRVRGGEELYV